MEYVPFSLLVLLVLAGLVAFGVGHKGWNWGTLAAAILVLLTATAFVYLFARVAERERAWRETVRRLQADLAKERDALRLDESGRTTPIDGQVSNTDLEDRRNRWKRALERVNTWRGRVWSNGSFVPPREKTAGRLTFAMPDKSAPQPFINAGSQVFLFDTQKAEEGGRFLGVLRVSDAKVDQGRLVLEVVPAADASGEQLQLWQREYEGVMAFESLPVDRWLAFYRTETAGDEEPEDGAASRPSFALPRLRKSKVSHDAGNAELLSDLEAQINFFEKHETDVPEEEWRPLVESESLPPGRYWAKVTFIRAHAITPKDTSRHLKSIQFEKGDSATLELPQALELEKQGVVDLHEVVQRRPLTDAETAFQGGVVSVGDEKPEGVRIQGAFAIGRILETEIDRATQAIKDLKAARANVENTIARLKNEKAELGDDLPEWEKDAATAVDVAAAIEARLTAASETLDKAWKAVVQMGREYDGSMAQLQAEAEKHAAGQR